MPAIEAIRFTGSPSVRRDSELQFETPTPWDGVRHDAYTVRFAMDHLARHRPRVLYLALGETDSLGARLRATIACSKPTRGPINILKELWVWLQSQPDYRGRTSLLITTDHGRGRTPGRLAQITART